MRVLTTERVEDTIMPALQQSKKGFGRVCVGRHAVIIRAGILAAAVTNDLVTREFLIEPTVGFPVIRHNLRRQVNMFSDFALEGLGVHFIYRHGPGELKVSGTNGTAVGKPFMDIGLRLSKFRS